MGKDDSGERERGKKKDEKERTVQKSFGRNQMIKGQKNKRCLHSKWSWWRCRCLMYRHHYLLMCRHEVRASLIQTEKAYSSSGANFIENQCVTPSKGEIALTVSTRESPKLVGQRRRRLFRRSPLYSTLINESLLLVLLFSLFFIPLSSSLLDILFAIPGFEKGKQEHLQLW